MNYEIKHEPENQRFITVIDGKECLIEYSIPEDGIIDFHHTFVPYQLRGRAIAAELVKTALNYARTNNFKVIPSCSYVNRFIERNKEYSKLVKEN
ncbi:MAG: GNAT family N-acetyltransferase [Ignavibacteriaceae bacterium]